MSRALKLPQRMPTSPGMSAIERHSPAGPNPVSAESKAELDRYLERFEERLPQRLASCVRWLREPSSIFWRIPISAILILGGIFSFLPVLGIWMLPLGLILIAQDIPFLQAPIVRMLQWAERKWNERQARKNAQK